MKHELWTSLLLLGICGLALAAGCNIERAIGPSAARSVTEKTILPDGTVVEKVTVDSAQGGQFTGKAAEKFETGPVSVNGNRAGGSSWQSLSPGGMKVLYIIGGLAVVLGALLGYVISWKLGAVISGAGASLACGAWAAERYPWAVLIVGLAVLGAGAYVAYQLWLGERTRKAATTIVRAVEEYENTAATEELKETIEKLAGQDKRMVKDTVTRIKRGAGLE